jgi:hypothetical protein
MKIVINKCYGGFGISLEAEKEYLKRKGKKAFFYTQTKYEYIDKIDEFTRIDNIDTYKSYSYSVFTKDLGKTFTKWPKEKGAYFYCGDIDRTDPDLIAVVEKLGDKANGACAELKIVEIPNGTRYIIDDYDGIESIHQEHESWG